MALDRLTAMDPLRCHAWDSLLDSSSGTTFFQGSHWARVLCETYGHTPCYFARIVNSRFEELLPVMEVSSRLTGLRGVSLPFTDSCPPLKAPGSDGRSLYQAATRYGRERGWRYLECRGNDREWPGSSASLAFLSHIIELEPSVEALFKRLEGAIKRGIRKAEGSRLQIQISTDEVAMQPFFALHARTRSRKGVPPQPVKFFENIGRYILARGHGFVVTARFEGSPVASAVFFHQGSGAIYKFGASDMAFQQLRPNNLVMWEAIKHCVGLGLSWLHLGRTSVANDGLRRFKLGFGAREEKVEYFKYDFRKERFVADADRAQTWLNKVFRCLPLPALRLAGAILYPHLS